MKTKNFITKKEKIANIWLFIFIGYIIYLILFIISQIFAEKINKYGFIIFLLTIICCSTLSEKSTAKKTLLSYLIIIFIIILFVPLFYNINYISFDMFLKYLGFYIILILCYINDIIFINENKYRWLFLISILSILISSILFKMVEVGGQIRLKGFFVNPNNLALYSFSLLFFLDEEHDKNIIKIMVNIIIISLLIMSATSGAIIAYIIGMTYKMLKTGRKKSLFFIIVTLLIFSLGYFLENIPFLTRIKIQIAIIFEERYKLSNYYHNFDYGYLIEKYGAAGYTSALTRIQIWMKALTLFNEQSILYKLFGGGAKYSEVLCKVMPHNEYIRILLDYGIIGLIIFLLIFMIIFISTKKKYQYIILIFLIFFITENVFDNMLFMTLLSLFIPSIIENKKTLACKKLAI